MSENTKSGNGRQLLTEKDFAEVIDAEGNPLPSVPKHWTTEQLPAGASFKGRTRSSSGTGTSGSGSSKGPEKPEGEPKGNASTEEWVTYARTRGAEDADLLGDDGEPLGQAALRAKYGTPAS